MLAGSRVTLNRKSGHAAAKRRVIALAWKEYRRPVGVHRHRPIDLDQLQPPRCADGHSAGPSNLPLQRAMTRRMAVILSGPFPRFHLPPEP
jgi:hypothetical protein